MKEKDKKNQQISEAEKVIATLNGQVNSDKKKLIDAIHMFRSKNTPSYETIVLGVRLYQILLENGLNESDVINPERLMGKVEGYIYEEKFSLALEILEVLDAMEVFQKYSTEGNKIYAVSNYAEKEMAIKTIKPVKNQTVEFIFSARSYYNAYKMQIYNQIKDEKNLIATINETLDFNPVDFSAHLYKAVINKKNLKKYKALIDDCYNYAYTTQHLITIFQSYAEYFEQKSDLPTAYSLLSCIKIYEDESFVQDELNRLHKEMNKTVISPYQVPDVEQILKILKNNNISYIIKPENFNALCSAYSYEYMTNGETSLLRFFRKTILSFSSDEQIIKELEKSALKVKNKEVR